MIVKPKRRRRIRFEISRDKFLSTGEALQLEAVLDRNLTSDRHRRDATMLYLCLVTGGRAREILNIKVADFCQDSCTVLIRGLKGSHCRELPIPKHIGAALKVLTNGLFPTELIFKISYHRMRDIWVLYRPVEKKLHSLRHTFAIRLYKRKKDVRLLQMALGHRSLMNTMVYVEYLYRVSELKKLILED